MNVDARLVAALAPFSARARRVTFGRSATVSIVTAALVAQLAWLAGVRSPWIFALLFAAALIASAFDSMRRPASLFETARRIDRLARLDDLVVSAVGCRGDGMPAVVRRGAIDALQRLRPAALYPFEAPRSWRRLALAVAIVQVISLVVVWRAPAERAQPSGLSSLALPAGGGPASARGADQPPTKSASAAAPEVPRPTAGAPPASVVATSGQLGAASAAAADHPGSNNRLTLAAQNADDEIRAGRVPIARRALVQRYFAAIQNQGKRSR